VLLKRERPFRHRCPAGLVVTNAAQWAFSKWNPKRLSSIRCGHSWCMLIADRDWKGSSPTNLGVNAQFWQPKGNRMRRRDLLMMIGSIVVVHANMVRAQQGERVKRIGVLMSTSQSDPDSRKRTTAFIQHLRELGWSDGQNARIEYRWAAGDMDRIQVYAKELVQLRPDVILVLGPAGTLALARETHSLPIVFALFSDPVDRGLVSNLAKPGGNVTGFANLQATIAGKWIEILKQIAPQVARIAVLFDPVTTPNGGLFLSPLRIAASQLGAVATAAPVKTAADIERVIFAYSRKPGGGFVVLPNPVTDVHRKTVLELADRYRLPAVYPYQQYVEDGGLVSYGLDATDVFRRAAEYVDRILRGETPGNLPIQQPTKFELVVNLKTARTLGVTIPPSVLVMADRVIE
jgi:putative ABC transport system substrate-binding protein